MTYFPGRFLASARCLLLAVILTFTPGAFSITVAQAQTPDLSTEDVTIDLSVIDGPATAPLSAPFKVAPRGITPLRGLLRPGKKNPVSRLHVAVPKATGRIKLKKSGRKSKKIAKRAVKKVKKKTRIRPAKIKKPAPPTVTATKPPAPLSFNSPAVPVVAPAPPPVVEMPKAKKQQMAKAAPKPVKKPAKKTAAKAPAPRKQKTAKAAVEKPMAAKVVKPTVKIPQPPKAAPPSAPPPQIPVKKAQAKPVQKEQAALPPVPETTKTGRALRVSFGAKASKIPVSAKKGLQSLAAKLKSEKTLRLQLMAYAGGNSLSASKARRLSLSRALSVRSFLIENGVRSTRIDVRALGSKTTEKPLNRVDVNIVER
jgi:outer membrane protein OmpA-like peptidoglycan-associated protein